MRTLNDLVGECRLFQSQQISEGPQQTLSGGRANTPAWMKIVLRTVAIIIQGEQKCDDWGLHVSGGVIVVSVGM